MADVTDAHRSEARRVEAMGHRDGVVDPPLHERIAQALADAEERGARRLADYLTELHRRMQAADGGERHDLDDVDAEFGVDVEAEGEWIGDAIESGQLDPDALQAADTPEPKDLRAVLAALVEAVGRGDEVGLPEAYRAAVDALRTREVGRG